MTRSITIPSRESIIRRKQLLTNLIHQKEEALRNAPRGSLRISCSGKRVQYYRRLDPKDKNGVYLKKSEQDTIERLAQKHYDKLVLKAAKKELKALEQYGKNYPVKPVEEIIESIGKEWERLVHPIRMSDARYVEQWISVEYEKSSVKGLKSEFVTDRGEIVRSKSELIIANYLFHHGIPYRYEYPIHLNGLGWIHPDFVILNVRLRKEIIWEHHGRMDDEGYAKKAVYRFNCYQKNGYIPGDNLIYTLETSDTPIDMKILRDMVNRFCV